MKIPFREEIFKDVKAVKVHVKVCDGGHYDLVDSLGNIVAEKHEDYVPDFFPGSHYGDYLILEIDIETGKILNWRQPKPQEVCQSFKTMDDATTMQ